MTARAILAYQRLWLPLLLFMLLVVAGKPAGAQTPRQRPTGRVPAAAPADSAKAPRPVTAVAAKFGTRPAAPPDTLRVPLGRGGGQRDIETTIVYSARDSIRLDAPGKVAYLYGNAEITYGTTHLEAALVKIEYGLNMVTAEGAPDSTGKLVDTPIFTDKGEQYEAKKIAYNFKTKKGKISEAITKQGEGYIHAEAVKRQSEKELYGLHGQYTTCDLPEPHYYIAASKMKVVPGEKIVTGPFNLVIADIPTPLGFLFGYFPTPKSRSSGIIIPSYGEAPSRGFFLTNGGYYWAASEHVGVRLTGDFYTLGGWAARGDVQYRKRYKYDGAFQLSYLRNQTVEQTGVATDLNPSRVQRGPDAIRVNWSHSPISRPGKGRLTANVNAGSSGFYRGQVNTTAQNALTTSFQSTVSYSGAIRNSPFNYNVSANQAQTFDPKTGVAVMDFQLPTVGFGMAQQTPLHWLARRTNRRVFNNLTVSYSLSATNAFSTVRTPGDRVSGLRRVVGEPGTIQNLTLRRDGLGAILRNGRAAVGHTINVGLGTYSLAHLNLSPSISYDEAWTFEKLSYRYDPDSQGVRIDRQRGLYRVYRYGFGFGAATRLYGLLRLPKSSRVEAVRLMLSPQVSYTYSPNFGDSRFGYFQTGVRTDASGRYQALPRYAGAPSGGQSSTVSFGISSNVEAKVRPAAGDTATKSRKVMIISQMSVRSGYNLAADSFQLAPVSGNLNTRLFDLFDINMGVTLDPYQRDSAGRRLPRYLAEAPGRKIARLASANFSVGFEFNSTRRQQGGSPGQQAAQGNVPGLVTPMTDLNPATSAALTNAELVDYQAFELPWTLRVSFGLNYLAPGPRGQLPGTPLLAASTIQTSGSVQLTKKWAITYSAPFDTRTKELVYPNISIVRDLHCWALSASWVPVGQYQSYLVNLGVRSSMLQDLKLTRNRSYSNR
ncbi:MAG: LPS-assembly protein LptD [Hymenobacteraceae bacterium]|nr:LPS-assembly protein LptD [Hymenobacteraceae bacterium]